MRYMKVKKLALALVSIVTIATSVMPVSAQAATSVSYETQLTTSVAEQEEQAQALLKKLNIANTYTMEQRYTSTSSTTNFGYICYRPEESKDESKALIIYLHGKDGCGSDLNKLLQIEGIPNYIANGYVYPDAVVIAPQCPTGSSWVAQAKNVMELIMQVIEEENIDPSRISITGASLGGIGTYYLAYTYPNFFSAVVPVCGNVNASRCSVINDCPVWIFHGTLDTAMGFSCKEATTVINNAGGNCTLTWIQNEGHEIRHVYYDAEYNLLDWMASQQRVVVTEEE